MVFENRTLERWHAAGLLDDGARDRIRAWEVAHARPVWLWALAAVGAFAMVLGVAALVAANWDMIPGGVKIGCHLALDVMLAFGVFLAWRSGWSRVRELLALVLFGLVLSGIGLVGQVYKLGGTTWQGLLTWMAVCTPFLVLVTRSGLPALAWTAGAVTTYAFSDPFLRALDHGYEEGMNLIWMPLIVLVGLGVLRGLTVGGKAQGDWIKAIARTILLLVVSLPQLTLRIDGSVSWRENVMPMTWGLVATVALLLLLAVDRWRYGRWDVVTAALAVTGWATWWATASVWNRLYSSDSVATAQDGAQLAVALIFVAFWGVVSWLALRSGRRTLFAVAFVVIAFRVFLSYWEEFGSILSTGIGLLLGGVVCIGLAALGWRIARWVQPAVAAR